MHFKGRNNYVSLNDSLNLLVEVIFCINQLIAFGHMYAFKIRPGWF